MNNILEPRSFVCLDFRDSVWESTFTYTVYEIVYVLGAWLICFCESTEFMRRHLDSNMQFGNMLKCLKRMVLNIFHS